MREKTDQPVRNEFFPEKWITSQKDEMTSQEKEISSEEEEITREEKEMAS